MPQYALLLYAPTPADWTEASPEELEAHERYAAQIEELGGRTVSAQALEPSSTATARRGGAAPGGPGRGGTGGAGGARAVRSADRGTGRQNGKRAGAGAELDGHLDPRRRSDRRP